MLAVMGKQWFFSSYYFYRNSESECNENSYERYRDGQGGTTHLINSSLFSIDLPILYTNTLIYNYLYYFSNRVDQLFITEKNNFVLCPLYGHPMD